LPAFREILGPRFEAKFDVRAQIVAVNSGTLGAVGNGSPLADFLMPGSREVSIECKEAEPVSGLRL
jgi:hypothetical protein